MNIFESLGNLEVSESCFNDIVGIVEEILNEAGITIGKYATASKNVEPKRYTEMQNIKKEKGADSPEFRGLIVPGGKNKDGALDRWYKAHKGSKYNSNSAVSVKKLVGAASNSYQTRDDARAEAVKQVPRFKNGKLKKNNPEYKNYKKATERAQHALDVLNQFKVNKKYKG